MVLFSIFCNILHNLTNSGVLYISHKVKQLYVMVFMVCVIIFLGVMFISPMAGLLADIKFGRYKTLKYSAYYIIFVAAGSCLSICIIVFTVVMSIITPHHIKRVPFLFIALITTGVLMTGSIVFTTNAINFGMDQLHDSSTQDSILFVHWYV